MNYEDFVSVNLEEIPAIVIWHIKDAKVIVKDVKIGENSFKLTDLDRDNQEEIWNKVTDEINGEQETKDGELFVLLYNIEAEVTYDFYRGIKEDYGPAGNPGTPDEWEVISIRIYNQELINKNVLGSKNWDLINNKIERNEKEKKELDGYEGRRKRMLNKKNILEKKSTRGSMEIGIVPANENPQQVGSKDYDSNVARFEGELYIKVLKEAFGEPPGSSRLYVKAFPHDFGSYYEVVVKFDENSEEEIEYAFKCEGEAPTEWPEWAKEELENYKRNREARKVEEENPIWKKDGVMTKRFNASKRNESNMPKESMSDFPTTKEIEDIIETESKETDMGGEAFVRKYIDRGVNWFKELFIRLKNAGEKELLYMISQALRSPEYKELGPALVMAGRFAKELDIKKKAQFYLKDKVKNLKTGEVFKITQIRIEGDGEVLIGLENKDREMTIGNIELAKDFEIY